MWRKKRINLKAAAIAAFALSFKSLFYPKPILAALTDNTCTINGIFYDPCPNQLCQLEDILVNIISVSASLAAIVLFVMLVVGGIRYLTSGGDPKGTQAAKSTLTYAVVGFALLIVAWFVLYFIYIFTGVDVRQFTIFECS